MGRKIKIWSVARFVDFGYEMKRVAGVVYYEVDLERGQSSDFISHHRRFARRPLARGEHWRKSQSNQKSTNRLNFTQGIF